MKKLTMVLGLAAVLATSSLAVPLEYEQDSDNDGGGWSTEEAADLGGGKRAEGEAQADVDAENFVPSNNSTSILSTLWQIVIGAHFSDLR